MPGKYPIRTMTFIVQAFMYKTAAGSLSRDQQNEAATFQVLCLFFVSPQKSQRAHLNSNFSLKFRASGIESPVLKKKIQPR